ncbi:ABC-2 type transporter-domain-containing protein [Phycomyces blakesleeanus]|uniref:ABC-2 type transporter-domain-containing protein n=1 Tax=Phycomyces blakesleeanus TaxID=4837 RepID=A0ABR3AN62_PHYBL
MSEKTHLDPEPQHKKNYNLYPHSHTGSADTVIEDAPGNQGTYGETDVNTVNIQDAINEYEDLKRELTHISRESTNTGKLEEGLASSDEFRLDEFLHGVSSEADKAGHTKKHIGVVWKNLSVKGVAAEANTIPTVASFPLEAFNVWKVLLKRKVPEKTILHNISGFCKDGEMLLVLGRPGAGCTTLLKIISNMRGSYTEVNGDVSYGGIDSNTFADKYRGQVCYNEEEDQHFPTLTAKQTLQFALRTKTPGARLPDESRHDFVNRVLYMLGNMLGLTKQMNTMVGNASVRGLSGGERKRLSIAEQMTTSSSINCWDCSTRGLDAASALDFVRSLRIMTDVLHKTTVATLYQASNSIFNLFDKVILLDDGYCLYFGPVEQAKPYFEKMGFFCPPRKSAPDFLTGICNPLEREFQPGYENSVPQFAHEFQTRYMASDIYKTMMAELEEYENTFKSDSPAETFKQAMNEEHQKRAPSKSPFIASFYQQVIALLIRQYHLLIKDKEALYSRYGTILIQSLVTASNFFNLPLTGAGAFSRGSALFFSVVFNSFVSQTELVRFLMGRPVLEKHKQYALYRPSAFYIAQVIMDVPYALAQVALFGVCYYFMIGLNMTAGKFFTFFINLFFINMTMNGFFRFFGAITSSFFLATQVSGTLLVVALSYVGYTIPYPKMYPWLYWFYWINPLAYGYKALLVNEMNGQEYSCEGPGNAVPYGPGYDNWDYKVCTMTGGVPGENFVKGESYLLEKLSYRPWEAWAPDFLVVVAYFLLFTVLCALCMEYISTGGGGNTTKLYIPGKAPKARTDEEENERRKRLAKITDEMDSISTGTTFSWQDIKYTVPIKGGNLQLLNGINGIVKPGHLTALMGSSGAGKTTLLDVLARRKTIGSIEGTILLNGEALMSDFERITGYCEQMDIHQPAVTVREALRFSAYLRQDESVPKSEKNEYVEKIIQLLEMEDIADAQIGMLEYGSGISVEERKRLTIGMELVGKPQLLFLDEPTSGLDAQSSYNIIRFIRKLADAGWPVLCTIHQPSAILFGHFDHLLLLVRGGKTAYYGEIGPDAHTMIDYFQSNGGPTCPPAANPAEYILEVVGAGTAGKATRDWSEVWAGSKEAKALDEELAEINRSADMNPTRVSRAYATSTWTQFKLVHNRMALAYWRAPDYNFGRFLNILLTALIHGFTYWKLKNSSSDMQNKLFALFSTFIMAMTLIILSQPKFMTERIFFRREYASRYYSWFTWGISTVLVEVPYVFVFAAFFLFCFYWTAGMTMSSEATGYFYLMLVLLVFWAVTFGFVIAAASELPTVAAALNPLMLSLLIVFCGLMQPYSAMPTFWKRWMYWIDPFHYYIEGLAVNELESLTVVCKDEDLLKFSAPPGQTCGQYMANFFSNGGLGYIDNPDTVGPELCGYCTYKSGEEYYSSVYGWEASNKWRNIGIIAAYFGFNSLVMLVLVYWRRKAKR